MQILRSFNIEGGLIKTRPGTNLKFKYGGSGSAILLKGQLGEFSKTTIGVRQGCLLSPILFLEKIMQGTLHDHYTSISPLMEGPYTTYNLPVTSIL